MLSVYWCPVCRCKTNAPVHCLAAAYYYANRRPAWTAWEQAFALKRRAFYERATDTLRTCPENYLIAVRALVYGQAVYSTAKLDAALHPYKESIDTVIKTWRRGSTADALADEIGKVLPKESIFTARDQRFIDAFQGKGGDGP